jgi:hypothetical protein
VGNDVVRHDSCASLGRLYALVLLLLLDRLELLDEWLELLDERLLELELKLLELKLLELNELLELEKLELLEEEKERLLLLELEELSVGSRGRSGNPTISTQSPGVPALSVATTDCASR